MNRYTCIGLIALLLFVIVLPVYALLEPGRMGRAQADLRRQYVADGAVMYVENCALCHGVSGEGIGVMPALNNPALSQVDFDAVYDTIAHSPHGSAMAAWHIEEGGVLNDYQVRVLVTLIRNAAWPQVSELAAAMDLDPSRQPTPVMDMEALEVGGEGAPNPHECRACHEEPAVHAERFGINCARCHTLVSWQPALLTRHIFDLEHGGEGQIPCQACHESSYSEYGCYGCHDHDPEQMQKVHLEEDIVEFEECAECHPTGREGEAEQFWKSDSAMDRGYDGELSGDAHTTQRVARDPAGRKD
jgi:mono/diheme cytochrome c family protein